MNVSTREFQLNQKEYLDKVNQGEQIVLTNRNVPVAYVVKELAGQTVEITPIPTEYQIRLIVKMVLQELGKGTPAIEPIPEVHLDYKNSKVTPEVAKDILKDINKVKTISGRYEVTATTLPMWCQGHFEQGVTHTCYKISYEDENGAEVLKEKWFCEKCVRSYMNRVGKVYGHLE